MQYYMLAALFAAITLTAYGVLLRYLRSRESAISDSLGLGDTPTGMAAAQPFHPLGHFWRGVWWGHPDPLLNALCGGTLLTAAIALLCAALGALVQ